MTLVLPPGKRPRAMSVPTRGCATSLMVPSPPNATTASKSRSTASLASSIAWSRWRVSWTSSLKSAERALAMTSFVRAETEPARGLEMSITLSTPGMLPACVPRLAYDSER